MTRPVTPLLAVDCVVLDTLGRVLLIRRGNAPFLDRYALPGGFVEVGETVEDACRREVAEETGVALGELDLVGVYSDPRRDPRAHCVSVAFLARVGNSVPVAGSDAAAAEFVEDWRGVALAFDHATILADAMGRTTGAKTAAGPKTR